MTITISEDLDCSGLPELDYEVCKYDEGFIAALLESFTGKSFQVKEIDCWCTGDRTCRFCRKSRINFSCLTDRNERKRVKVQSQPEQEDDIALVLGLLQAALDGNQSITLPDHLLECVDLQDALTKILTLRTFCAGAREG